MRGFSPQPDRENAPLWRLDKSTGAPRKTNLDSEVVVKHFYRLHDVAPDQATAVEEKLNRIEGAAAGHIRTLLAGKQLNKSERQELANFLVLQWRRTPRGRHWFVEMTEYLFELELEVEINNDDSVRNFLKQEGRSTSDEDVRAFREFLRAQRKGGRLKVQATSDAEVHGMFVVGDEMAAEIAAETTWTVLRSTPPHEFIFADHPVCIYDPNAPPGRGVGWLSSGTTEVTIPLARHACLQVMRGHPETTVRAVDASAVRDLNLRSYASAEWAHYGSSQQVVQGVRTDARSRRELVSRYEPRKPHQFLLERQEGTDLLREVSSFEPRGAPARGFQRRPKRKGSNLP